MTSGSALPAQEAAEQWIDKNLQPTVELYQHFHRNPELSFHEEQTAARVAEELQKAGCDVVTGVGGHGVVGLLENGEGPTVMWRSDLDALPVVEATGLEYASTVRTENDEGVEVGVMHACGHDVHITNLIATARFFSSHRDQWQGTLMFVGQPAEERGAGARAMLEDGIFTRIRRPDFALALHVDATLPAGMVGYRSGYALANVDSCDITVKGRGGHGSFPQGCIDPIVQAAELVMAIQTIVSREVSPLEPAVVTVGSIHGGTKHNIIPDSCHLQLTIRSYSAEVRAKLKEGIIRRANAIAEAYDAPEPEIVYSEGTPAMFNDEALVDRVVPAIAAELGEEKLVLADKSMGGEDFSRYGIAGVPIFMFRLGSVEPERLDEFARRGTTPPSLHSAEYYPAAEQTLRTGFLATVSAIMELIGKHSR
ncbi:MAG: amidohydrolase [Planctomycetota bacterium]|nr:MAG: amidohydrolase [Planctomycetota bacterium]REK24417.1 MAG: amidohydrolase [Planctomycetota bacterium]REK38605.1 MAG: amidohydrolase [Planctomycetota bacterium]